MTDEEKELQWLLRKLKKMKSKGYSEAELQDYAAIQMEIRGKLKTPWLIKFKTDVRWWWKRKLHKLGRLWMRIRRRKVVVKQLKKGKVQIG